MLERSSIKQTFQIWNEKSFVESYNSINSLKSLKHACDQSHHGWRPHDVMRAPSCGALMTAWGRRHLAPSWRHGVAIRWRRHDGMRAPSCGAVLTSWGRHQVAPPWRHGAPPDWVSWRHEGATWWLPHDVMRAPAMMTLNASYCWTILKTGVCNLFNV